MNSVLLKRLFRAIHSGSPREVDSMCQVIIDDARKRGHAQVAVELTTILEHTSARKPAQAPHALDTLPTNKRDSAQLIQEIPRESLRHHMVLPETIERRFHRVECEFAARTRLALHGLPPRRRILLYGPPGCGKSLGAERLAWNTGLPLFKVRFDSLLSSYFGETLSNLRKVFDMAEKTPCALFLDECDTLARSRLERNDVGEVTRITNALLEILENHKGDGLVIAATNLDSSLDPALFRRFDEVLKIPLPIVDDIERLLRHTLSAIPCERSMPWGKIALGMDGMSCSEVSHVARNAAKHAILEGRKQVTQADLRFSLSESHERH